MLPPVEVGVAEVELVVDPGLVDVDVVFVVVELELDAVPGRHWLYPINYVVRFIKLNQPETPYMG